MKNNNILFVSGTDTGVGKTHVSCLILESLHSAGYRVAAVKPVETGFDDSEISDAELLRVAAGGWQSIEEVLYYHFPQAVSPNVAASIADVEICAKEILSRINALAAEVDFVLVEGAGGLMVPYSSSFRFIDLLEEAKQAVLLVVGSKLGAINHTALSVEAIVNRQLPFLGYVLNECEEPVDQDLARQSNGRAIAEELKRFKKIKNEIVELAQFPHKADDFTRNESGNSCSSEAVKRLRTHLIDYYKLTR